MSGPLLCIWGLLGIRVYVRSDISTHPEHTPGPALFPPSVVKSPDFRVIFVAKCQSRMEKGK